MKTEITLIIIAFINGYQVKELTDDFKDSSTGRLILGIVIFGIFGFLIIGISHIILLIVIFKTWINHILQLKFWWRYYITKEYKNLSEKDLKQMNLRAKTVIGTMKNEKKKMSISHYHFMYCLNFIKIKYNKQKDDEWLWTENPDNFIK